MWYNIYKTHKGKVSYIACTVIFAVIFSSFLTFWILSFIISFLCNLFCQLSKIPSDKFFMFPLLCPILSWFYSLPLYPLMGMGILRPIIEEHWLWLLILGDSHLFWERNAPTWAFFCCYIGGQETTTVVLILLYRGMQDALPLCSPILESHPAHPFKKKKKKITFQNFLLVLLNNFEGL